MAPVGLGKEIPGLAGALLLVGLDAVDRVMSSITVDTLRRTFNTLIPAFDIQVLRGSIPRYRGGRYLDIEQRPFY